MNLSKTLLWVGLLFLGLGMMMPVIGRIPVLRHLGRLPGDIRIEGKRHTFYFPWVSSLVLSAIITLILRFLGKHRR